MCFFDCVSDERGQYLPVLCIICVFVCFVCVWIYKKNRKVPGGGSCTNIQIPFGLARTSAI